MASPLPPPLSELLERLGVEESDLDAAETVRAERALHDATVLVLDEAPTATAAAWRESAPEVIEVVVLTAARRGYENPRGLAQETFGEHTVGISETSGVYLTPRELARVQRAAFGRTTRPGFIGSVRTPSAYGDG